MDFSYLMIVLFSMWFRANCVLSLPNSLFETNAILQAETKSQMKKKYKVQSTVELSWALIAEIFG